MKKTWKHIGKTVLFHGLFPFLYKWHARKPIQQNRVLFLEIRYIELTNNFTILYEEFCKRRDFTVDVSFLGNSVFSHREYIRACIRMLRKLATAQYVFVNESSNVLAALPIRKETSLIQTWHGCGAFKRFGYAGVTAPQEAYYNSYLFTTVSSPEVVDIYAKSMGQDPDTVLALGVSRTDVYFNAEYVASCEKQIRFRYGIQPEKQILLYAPTFRGNVQNAQAPRLLQVEKLYRGLGESYVILYKGHPAVRKTVDIPESFADFFMDVSAEPIEPLLCAASACITDYSSLIFEYSLLGRPMFFYAYDYKQYVTERGFYYPYDTFVPGKICYTEEELMEGILQEREAQMLKVEQFRERFMCSCDGHATTRIIETMLTENRR